jgi:MFS family permease
MTATHHWRRNLFAVTAASFIGFTGFTLVMPFLPLYFAQLGVTDVGEIAIWSGLSLGATPALTALLAPFWGRLADRFGRKIMVERSLLSFVVVMGAMAYVTEPWHVFALRLAQGLFAGYGALALTMAADNAPPGRMAQSIGIVQVAQRIGPAMGPVFGGALAGLVGLRRAFLVSTLFYLTGFLLVLFVYREPPRALATGSGTTGAGPPVTFRNARSFQNFFLLMGVIFGLQFVDRSIGPVLPLYVASLGVAPGRVAVVSGLLFSLVAGGGALGNLACDRLLKRWPARPVIVGGSGVAALAAAVALALPSLPALAAAMLVFGVSIGTAMTATYTSAGSVLPVEGRATGFGFMTSATLAGVAVSPVVTGFLGAVSIRGVWALDALALAVIALIVMRVMAGPVLKTESVQVEEV